MEGGVAEKQSSYTYWVRETKDDAAPLPVPRKLTPEDISKQSQPVSLGSVWNQAGTWEEKNLNSWANGRIKELLSSMSLEFSKGKAAIDEVTKCSGDAFLITVRNKKRVGYTFELTLRFEGEWSIKDQKEKIKGHVDIPEFSFGELDDLKIESRISNDISAEVKAQISEDLQSFLEPIRKKLSQFEQELKDR
ncbi:activator of 90 kDa heat shock protein ATPase homolog 2 isoform X1 [Dendrobium catenatum]|uniref:activator of 90 kDa heat shock protein ATPase homolog 2 isoform X1 n=1 Tax=Dendrobium catenatum TaxID=906689 RepID=UPI0009F20711|nr:activator of 90 kDa heat shock protein ATPase homolog 2 isoform X1 [Dendrobium catenatum]